MDLLGMTSGILCIGGAVYALNAKQLMRGVLGLAILFVGIAAFFAQLGAWYLAMGQLLLFVGGVVTLFVLAFNATKTPLLKGKNTTGSLIAIGAVIVIAAFFSQQQKSYGASISLADFAMQFFTQYGWIINISFLLLFGAIMGAQYLMGDT